MPSRAYLRGEKAMIGKIQAFKGRFPERVGAAQRVETEIEVTECKQVTPVDTGNLVNTIHAEGPFFEGNKIRTQIVAGGPSATYAVPVHEDLEAFHPHGEAKYIERPLFASAPYMAQRIAARL